MKNTNIKTATIATTLMLLLTLPFAAFAQYEENRGLFGRGGSSADYSYGSGESLMRQGEPNTIGTITNDSFGDAPLGSGIAILIAAGAGYAVVRRKRSRKNTMLLLVCVALLGFTQCKKEQPLESTNEGNGVQITLNVEKGGKATDGSRVDVTPPSVEFKNGDKILVAYDGKYVGTITHNGTYFTGNITITQNGTQPLYFYFLGNKNTGTLTAGETASFTVDISDQTSELPVISMAPSDQKYPSEGNHYTASLHNKCALVKISFPDGMNAPARIGGVFTTATIDFGSTDGVALGDKGAIKLYSEDTNTKWAILFPQTFASAPAVTVAGEACTVTVSEPLTTPFEIHDNDYISDGISVTNTPAVFSVASGTTVQFSQGNLQATTSDLGEHWTWSFAEHQYDYVGNGVANTSINGNGTVSENGTVDLFGWSTESTNYGIYHSENDGDYSGLFVDWGRLTIGGDSPDTWRTMTVNEWNYLFEKRTPSTVIENVNARYTMAKINTDGTTIYGLIVFPDSNIGDTPEGVTWGTINGYTQNNAWSTATTCTTAGWSALESRGCVFFPAGGWRRGTSVGDIPTYGGYWSSTIASGSGEYATGNIINYMFFNTEKVNGWSENHRHRGHSVRLVRNVN